jgi:hypothetical protein
MSSALSDPERIEITTAPAAGGRAWPLWGVAAGVLGMAATVAFDTRAGDTSDPEYMVTVADMADLDHEMLRIGGLVGYACVAALLVFAAVWHRRVTQRHPSSTGAAVVGFGLVATAATLTLAYGWKGALGNYLHGAAEEGTYDDQGLYVYYVMHDFSPYIGWVPMVVAAGGLAWMAFGEGLVSKPLGGVSAGFVVLVFGAVAVTGVPGLPFVGGIGLVVAGAWLAVGRSPIVTGPAA